MLHEFGSIHQVGLAPEKCRNSFIKFSPIPRIHSDCHRQILHRHLSCILKMVQNSCTSLDTFEKSVFASFSLYAKRKSVFISLTFLRYEPLIFYFKFGAFFFYVKVEYFRTTWLWCKSRWESRVSQTPMLGILPLLDQQICPFANAIVRRLTIFDLSGCLCIGNLNCSCPPLVCVYAAHMPLTLLLFIIAYFTCLEHTTRSSVFDLGISLLNLLLYAVWAGPSV